MIFVKKKNKNKNFHVFLGAFIWNHPGGRGYVTHDIGLVTCITYFFLQQVQEKLQKVPRNAKTWLKSARSAEKCQKRQDCTVLVLLSAQAERLIVSRFQDFYKLGPSGRVVVHMYVVPSPCHFFSRPLSGPQIT